MQQPNQSNAVPLPVEPQPRRTLSLNNVTVGEARQKMIEHLTAHWRQSLTTLAQKLTAQGFCQAETLELCESFQPQFEENMRAALKQFDDNADEFITQCSGVSRG